MRVHDAELPLAIHNPSWQVALARADTEFEAVTGPLTFYQNVSPTKELRDSSNEAESLVRDFSVESDMRIDVFNSKIAAEKNIKDSGKWDTLSPEEQRLVEKMVRFAYILFTSLN